MHNGVFVANLLAPAQFVLALGVAVLVTRRMRGRNLGWLAIPASSLVPAGLLALAGLATGGVEVGLVTGATVATLGLVGTAWGCGLALLTSARWNLRPARGLALVVLLLSVEAALVLGLWSRAAAVDVGGTSGIFALSGLALAMASARRGATPQEARWTRRVRQGIALTVVLGLAAWWLRTEALASAASPGPALAADLVANASTLTAWALMCAGVLAVVPVLDASGMHGVRKMGTGVVLAFGLLMPMLTGGMVLANRLTCDDHYPEADTLAELVRQASERRAAGWCRPRPEYQPRCSDLRTVYVLEDGHWRGEGPALPQGASSEVASELSVSHRQPDGVALPTDVIVYGHWGPEVVDDAVVPALMAARSCVGTAPVEGLVRLSLEEGEVVSVLTDGLGEDEETCLADALDGVRLPEPQCRGEAAIHYGFRLSSEAAQR